MPEHAIFESDRPLSDGLAIIPQAGEVSTLERDPETDRAERYKRFLDARPPTSPATHRLLGRTTSMVSVEPAEK